MPLISFVVPIYNSEEYLRQCLDSIVSQAINNYEVLLIDDGSTDSSGSICDEYVQKDTRFKVIHKKNEGLSAARNDGISIARGEWITFVDSDDWIESDCLKVIVDNHEVDYVVTSICKHNSAFMSEDEKFTNQKYHTIDARVFDEGNLKTAFFTAWSKFFKTEIIRRHSLRFIPNISPGEDTIFVFQYMNCIKSMCLSDAICYNWRVANGLTNRKRSFQWITCTIDHTITAIKQVEIKYQVNLSGIKFHSLHYLIDKINVNDYTHKQLCLEIRDVASKYWMKDMIEDCTYLKKGKRRILIDYLMRVKAYMLVAFVSKFARRFY